MGYRTNFKLTVKDDVNQALLGDNPRLHEIHEYIKNSPDDEYLSCLGLYEVDDERYFATDEPQKWYEHEEDIKKLSLHFKDIVFELEGEGEEWDDRWRKYFLNGMMQSCPATIIIRYPEFDVRKLNE